MIYKIYIYILSYYPIFRTKFKWDKTLIQEIFPIEESSQCCETVESFNDSLFYTPFFSKRKNEVLLRFYFNIKTSQLLFQTHHIIYDHGCDEAIKEIFDNALNNQIPSKRLNYIDYSNWENEYYISSSEYNEGILFWNKYLINDFGYTQLLIPKQNNNKTGLSNRIFWSLNEFETLEFSKLYKKYNTTFYTLFVSLFSDFLHQTYTQQTFYIGTLFHNRRSPQTFNMLGYFMNYICYKSEYFQDIHVSELINKWKENIKVCQTYGGISLSEIFKQPHITKIKNRQPFSTIIITEIENKLNNINTSYGEWTVMKQEFNQSAIFPLSCYIFNDKLTTGWIEYDIDLYSNDEITLLVNSFVTWIKTIIYSKV